MATRKEHPFRDYFDDDIRWWSALEVTPSNNDLDALEADLHMPLPRAYRRFQRLHGAVMVAASEEVWPPAELGKSGPYWTFLSGFLVIGLGEGVPEYMDIRSATARFHEEFPETSHLVPFFAYVDDADFHCFDNRGKIHSWSHEVVDRSKDQKLSFDQFLIGEMKNLVRRKNAVKEATRRYGKKWRLNVKYPDGS